MLAVGSSRLRAAMCRLPLLVCVTGAACSESTSLTSGDPATGIEVKVAPLNLPGIARACYDVAVRNGLGEVVWSRGDLDATWPLDETTLCSTQFGNGAGGDIAYVGPCDADEPNHTVELALDGLYDKPGADIGDYVNPCPATAPCTLPVICAENADTPVSFNFTIMRAANQGFFDIAVNFDSIFCSAKVDCTYDDEGNEPIELLYDPATGEPTQTAVVGFACTAGPGSDVSTTLMMNDIRVSCGDTGATLFGGFDVFSCTDDGAEFYGIVQAVTSNSVSFRSGVWTRDPATGHYEAGPVTLTNGAAFGFNDAEALPFLIVDADDAIGMVGEFGPMIGNDPLTAIIKLQPAVFHRVGSATWEIAQLMPFHAAATQNFGIATESPLERFVLVRSTFEQDEPGATLYLYPKTGGIGTWTYGEPVELARPAVYESCDNQQFHGSRFVTYSCTHTVTNDTAILAWDVEAAPSDLGFGLFIDAAVMPLVPSDFDLTDFGGGTLTVNRIEDFWSVGGLAGDGTPAGPDRIFGTVNLDVTDSNNNDFHFNTIVHFSFDGTSWAKAPPPFGQDSLPFEGNAMSINAGYSDIETVHDTGGAANDAIIAGAMFGGQYRRFVAVYDRTANTWTRHDRWEYDSGTGQASMAWAMPRSILRDALGAVFVIGEGRAGPASPAMPWMVRLSADPSIPNPVTFLPMPLGFTLQHMAGLRGASTGPTRRASAILTDVSNQTHALEWRLTAPGGGGLSLASWYVYGPDVPLPFDPNDSDLDDRGRVSDEQNPIFDSAVPRCTQFLDRYRLTSPGPLFEEAAFIVDPLLDTADLQAVSTRQVLNDVNGNMSGTLILRAPAAEPDALLPSIDPAAMVLLNPALLSEGNAWTSASPKPTDMPDHILQMASYHGEESLLCGGEPCNKLYWNTAIAFDPTVPNCVLAFEATAANSASLVGGQLPPNTAWPIIVGRVPLTGAPDEDGIASLECRQHPLNSDALYTMYKPGDFDWDLCYSFGESGANPSMSGLGCGYDATSYLQFDAMLQGGEEP